LSISTFTCANDTSCTATSSCTTCPYQYYLSGGQCVACPIIANCKTCNPTSNSSCLLCNNGYYLNNGFCQTCSSGCDLCSSSTYCTQASSGYYNLLNAAGSISGSVRSCGRPCKTCKYNAHLCLSCVNGYSIIGSLCRPNRILRLNLNLVGDGLFSENDSPATQVGHSMQRIGWFRFSLRIAFPIDLRAIFEFIFVINSLQFGSLIFGGTVDI
jgi:hypothetical protein